MPPAMVKETAKAAKREGRTKSELVREALRQYLAQSRFPIYSEQEILRSLKATRKQIWNERYAKQIESIS